MGECQINPNGPPKQYHFKPGVSGNPGGRGVNYLTRSKVKVMIDKYLALSKIELEALKAKETTPVLELMIISTILQCIKVGDYSRMEALLSRAIGRVQEIEDDVDSSNEMSKLSMHELLTLVKPITKDS